MESCLAAILKMAENTKWLVYYGSAWSDKKNDETRFLYLLPSLGATAPTELIFRLTRRVSAVWLSPMQ